MCLPTRPFKVEKEWVGPGGLLCAVTQAMEGMYLCGYVRVPPGHPLHGRDYDSVDLYAHGSVNFSHLEPCVEHEDGQGWWFGFDCGHTDTELVIDPTFDRSNLSAPDLIMFAAFERMSNICDTTHYWTLPEVVEEVDQLALQLAAVAIAAI